MIEVSNLTKSYGSKKALDNLSFTVKEGEILGFLGPNGAGKSTTMNIITGYLSADEGSVTVDGNEIFQDPIAVKKKIGYLPEHPPLYPDMTIKEYLSFIYDLKKLKLKKQSHIDEICALVQISDVYGRMIRNLSKGYKQRVGLAQALLGGPSVLILDEPTVGLDPKQILDIRELIKNLGKSHTVILSSHILPEIQAICERVVVLNNGKIAADGTPETLSRSLDGSRQLTLRIDGPPEQISAALNAIPGVKSIELLGCLEENSYDFSLTCDSSADLRRDIFATLSQNSWPLLISQPSELSLEDVFLQITSTDPVLENAETASATDALPKQQDEAQAIPTKEEGGER